MKKPFVRIGWPILVLVICALLLFMERSGVGYSLDMGNVKELQEERVYTDGWEQEKECLLVIQSSNENSLYYADEMKQILKDMRVGYELLDLESGGLPELSKYSTIVLTISDLSVLGKQLPTVSDWVKAGGGMMNTATYEPNSSLFVLAGKMGIVDGGNDYMTVGGYEIQEGFMIGGERYFAYDAPMDTSLNVQADAGCRVGIYADNGSTPLLWERDYGSGKFVVINQTLSGRDNRGFLCAAYSMLQTAAVYPVINASAFYLDDFPSPVPSGNGEFITRDYHMSISDFYSGVWWPQILKWEEEYGLRHTGLVIEDYSDLVSRPFPRQKSTERFMFFGNMLLNNGGEIGIHGYNHMPLCPDGFPYPEGYESYKTFDSPETMRESIQEVLEFTRGLFPGQPLAVYVPPSNILSDEGLSVLSEASLGIKALASTYLPEDGGCGYIQEFEVDENGMIYTPRITSGCNIDEFMYSVAYSELNYHYVQSHFLHPDDVLDVDRGAELGWGKLSGIFGEYLEFIYSSAPGIRNVTGSQMAVAVEKYDKLRVERNYSGSSLKLRLGGFSGDAYLMLRLTGEEIAGIEGAEYEHITGDLYLLHAVSDTVKISW